MASYQSLLWKARNLAARIIPTVLESNLRLLRDSGYFDAFWYTQNNPDVAAQGGDPLRHYLLYGALEGRSPSAKFDSFGYLESNPDVRAAVSIPCCITWRMGARRAALPTGKRARWN